MKLYEIAGEQARILARIEENGGEITAGDELAMQTMGVQLAEKVENCLKFLRNQEAEADVIDQEIERLKAVRDRCKRSVDSIEGYLLRVLSPEYVQHTSLGKLSFRESERCTVTDEAKIPKKFWRAREPVPDVAAAKVVLQAGKAVAGFTLEKHYSLQLR